MNVLARDLHRSAAPAALTREILDGLSQHPKSLPAKLFYDEAGSTLFERITELPEYYPTRAEAEILQTHARDIAALLPQGAALVEFGAGSSAKTRTLLHAASGLRAYVPVDVSGDFLLAEARRLRAEFPAIEVEPLVADFTGPFHLPISLWGCPLVGFFPGSTIGNFEPDDAARLLRHFGRMLGRGACLIVGVDLVKDRKVLHAAYNDAAGVTAAFNVNMLARLNREFDADFDLDAFWHRAFFNEAESRIEMHLESTRTQTVSVAGQRFTFEAGELLHTENSYKYTPERFRDLLARAGWRPGRMWRDGAGYFSVHVASFEGR